MLIYLLLQIPLLIINGMTSWLPSVEQLPFGLDAILATGFGYLFYITAVVPPRS